MTYILSILKRGDFDKAKSNHKYIDIKKRIRKVIGTITYERRTLMYICEGSGLMQYETFDELLNADNLGIITENKKNYYIIINYDNQYHNTVWVVNKKTQNVSQIYFTEYLVYIMDNTTPVDLKTLKEYYK